MTAPGSYWSGQTRLRHTFRGVSTLEDAVVVQVPDLETAGVELRADEPDFDLAVVYTNSDDQSEDAAEHPVLAFASACSPVPVIITSEIHRSGALDQGTRPSHRCPLDTLAVRAAEVIRPLIHSFSQNPF